LEVKSRLGNRSFRSELPRRHSGWRAGWPGRRLMTRVCATLPANRRGFGSRRANLHCQAGRRKPKADAPCGGRIASHPTALTRSSVPTPRPSHAPPRSRSAESRSPPVERLSHVGGSARFAWTRQGLARTVHRQSPWHDKPARSRGTGSTRVHVRSDALARFPRLHT